MPGGTRVLFKTKRYAVLFLRSRHLHGARALHPIPHPTHLQGWGNPSHLLLPSHLSLGFQRNFLIATRLLKIKNQKGKYPASSFCFLPTLRQSQNLAPYLNEDKEKSTGRKASTWHVHTAAAAKSRQLCLTLCDPIDGSPPGSPVPGILQARTLEWVAISFSSE